MVSRFLSWLAVRSLDSIRYSLRLCFFFHAHSFALSDTEICLPLPPCCAVPLQLCMVSFTSAVPRSQVWLFWITLHPCGLCCLSFALSLSTNMLFNTGLSNPCWSLLRNSFHCEPRPFLCPSYCVFSQAMNPEECLPTGITQLRFWAVFGEELPQSLLKIQTCIPPRYYPVACIQMLHFFGLNWISCILHEPWNEDSYIGV